MKKYWETNVLINWLNPVMNLHNFFLSENIKDTNPNIWKMMEVKDKDHLITEKGLWLNIQTERKIK